MKTNTKSDDRASRARIAAINAAVATFQRAKGCSYHEAWAAVKRQQPALFSAVNSAVNEVGLIAAINAP